MPVNSTTLTWASIFYIIMEIVIGLCAILGNVLVIWVVKLNRSLHTTTFYFIVSLALADIAVGVLVMPLAVVVSLGLTVHFYSCLLMTCLLLVFTHASIMFLLAIAVDRYLRVKLTVRYRSVTTQRRIWCALGLCWLLSILVGLTPMFGWNKKLSLGFPRNVTFFPCQFRSVMRMDYMVYFSFFTWIFIPLVAMCAIYMDIFCIIRNKLSLNFSSSRETGSFYGREFKTAKSLFLVLFLFALSWLPLSIINCIIYFDGEVPQVVLNLGILLSHANSMMNPIVYAFKIKKFKETYFFIFKTCMNCQPSDSLDPHIEQISYPEVALKVKMSLGVNSKKLNRESQDKTTLSNRYLFLLNRSRIAEIPHFRPAMGLFVLLSLTVLSEAMVMDKKVKESFVLDTVSAVCSYGAHYKDHLKYWCRGYYRDYCNIIAFTPNSTGRVALRDTGEQLIVTVSCLTKEDAGWYWCGIQRDFARDDMDFTELVVTDYRGAHTSDFWSVKDASGNMNRSCRASKPVYKADHYRMSILITCVLITGVGIISLMTHLFKRRRIQRNRRSKGLTRSQKTRQAASAFATPLVGSLLGSSA
ncbi:adenosine receptor A3 [Myotis yumanensis]|uniref:adenosine receptor A3 n=1 Tax=Myotis yumanensis TaxID=159337 RepID=UPI0038D3BB65